MTEKKYESLMIENIVASGVIAESIDLVAFSENTENCELNKKRFPGAVYRIPDPKIACLVFSSGKIVLTGLRNHAALARGIAVVADEKGKSQEEMVRIPLVGNQELGIRNPSYAAGGFTAVVFSAALVVCPLKMRVGANSPNLWLTIFSDI